MAKDPNKLTDKQKAFAEAYTDNIGTVNIKGEEKQTFNHATRSAIKAGYKDGSQIHAIASKTMKLSKVQQYINELRLAYKSKAMVGLEWAKQQYLDRYEAWKDQDKTNARGCLDSFVRMHGGFTDNINDSRKETESSLSPEQRDIIEQHTRQAKIALSKPQEA